jgi:hypothetical protein
MGATIPHLVLLGDSTFDNGFYVGKDNPAIIDQLSLKAKERGWKATSVAVDGHSISHISSQLTRIPEDATHLFISIGNIFRERENLFQLIFQVEMMDFPICNV